MLSASRGYASIIRLALVVATWIIDASLMRPQLKPKR
jgi:hypothetical protein